MPANLFHTKEKKKGKKYNQKENWFLWSWKNTTLYRWNEPIYYAKADKSRNFQNWCRTYKRCLLQSIISLGKKKRNETFTTPLRKGWE